MQEFKWLVSYDVGHVETTMNEVPKAVFDTKDEATAWCENEPYLEGAIVWQEYRNGLWFGHGYCKPLASIIPVTYIVRWIHYKPIEH